MWLNGKWLTDTEVIAYVAHVEAERDAYKNELVNVLQKACECIFEGDCSNCSHELDLVCLSKLDKERFRCRLRLEELTNGT